MSDIRKTQPALKFPGLQLPKAQGSKIISTPTEMAAAQYIPKKNRTPDEGAFSATVPSTTAGPASGWVGPGNKAYIRGGIDPKRVDSIEAHENMHQQFQHIRKEYGKTEYNKVLDHVLGHASPTAVVKVTQALKDLGYDEKDPSFKEELINYFHTYITDPENRKRIQDRSQSATKKMMVDRHIKQSWRRMLAAANGVRDREGDEISKSIKSEHAKKLASAAVPSDTSVTDHTLHLQDSKPNATLQSIRAMPHAVPPQKFSEGMSPKLVMQNPHDGKTVMLKPYHAKIDPATRAYASLPIHGWATMATKALFDAGKIGHLAENVSTEEHEGTPVTTHEFAEGYHPLHQYGDASKSFAQAPSVDSDDVQKVALIDYLSNNNDRHAGNLMVNPDKQDDRGHSPLLAIDHEKNFQYSHNPSVIRNVGATDRDHASHYFGDAAPGIRLARRMSVDGGHENVVKWWSENSPHIRSAMERQLSGIRDKRVREHVRQNFNDRANSLDSWTKNPQSSPFDQTGPAALMNRFPSKYVQEARAIEKHLPQDPGEAARKVLDWSVEQPFSARNKEVMTEVINNLVDKMSPKEIAELMQAHHKHPLFNVRDAIAHRRFTPEESAEFKTHVTNMMQQSPDAAEKFPFLVGAFNKTPEAA